MELILFYDAKGKKDKINANQKILNTKLSKDHWSTFRPILAFLFYLMIPQKKSFLCKEENVSDLEGDKKIPLHLY